MRPSIRMIIVPICVVAATAMPAAPRGVVELSDLWPRADGNDWIYALEYEDISGAETGTARLYFDGTAPLDGATGQRLFGEIQLNQRDSAEAAQLDGFWRALWTARPDLRSDMMARALRGLGWPIVLLGPADGEFVGYLQTAERIGVWRDQIANWSWWWLTDDLDVGAGFTLQLVPDLADDVFLTGEIRTQSGDVDTPAQTFNDAFIVDYVLDYGESTVVDDMENELGTITSTTEGWVAFVPGVGPVAADETFSTDLTNCAACDPADFPDVSGSLRLSGGGTPIETTSWGSLKERFAAD